MKWFLPLWLFLLAGHLKAQVKYTFSAAPETGKEIEVSFKIPVKGLSGMARLQQDFPKGFEVSEAEQDGSILTFSNGTLQLLWIQIPAVDSLPVKYTLRALQGYGGKAEIPGVFYFIQNAKRESIRLNPMVLQVSGEAVKRFTPVKKEAEPVASAKSTPVAKPVEKPRETSKPPASSAATEAKAKGSEAAAGNVKKEAPKPSQEGDKKPVAANNPVKPEAKETAPSKKSVKADKVSFRIQIAAAQEKANVQDLAKKFGVEADKIKEEEHSGMFKYTVGEYPSLADARKVLNANPALKSGAFVAGYQNGQRIELEEAIRLSKTP